jgi:type IV pilus assembly protein PilV
MKNLKNQNGVGMIEVLVALLILALGVLGYVAVQLRAIDASAEALTKSQAVLVMRGLAENIRSNPAAIANYPTLVAGYNNYSSSTAAPTTCLNTVCTPVQMAAHDAFHAAKNADQYGMKITMDDCPGVTNTMTLRRKCLYTFWGKTEPVITNCMSTTGTYVSGSSCLMLEVY